jgi:hypothetical protein
MQENPEEPIKLKVPSNFGTILMDFTNDLSITFPEYEYLWSKWRTPISSEELRDIYIYCLSLYPERFFDILYQNDDIFLPESKTNTFFLPKVDFKYLFHCENITQTTKTALWKYIQLILFTIVENVKDKTDFGKTMNLFEGMDESELQSKLSEAMMSMASFFKPQEESKSGESESNPSKVDESETNESESNKKPEEQFFEKMMGEFGDGFAEKMKDFTDKMGKNENDEPKMKGPSFMPNADDLHNHLKDLFEGKLGILAKELIEELTEELKDTFTTEDLNSNTTPRDIFQKLMKNPDKFMKIVQKINTKFQEKMKKGDISQDEIMKEATEMLKKMKEMGGNSKQMNEMFQNMAKSMGGMGLGKNARVDTNALDRMMKTQSTKERLRSKLEQKKQAEYTLHTSNNPEHLVYRPNNSELPSKSAIPVPVPSISDKEYDIDKIVAEIEAAGEKTKVTTGDQNKKKKKKKKN